MSLVMSHEDRIIQAKEVPPISRATGFQGCPARKPVKGYNHKQAGIT